MGHLTHRFITSGLSTDEHLRAISQCPPQELEVLLHGILTQNGRETTLVDVRLLRLHFAKYFPNLSPPALPPPPASPPYPTNVTQVAEVQAFLQACNPPMGVLILDFLSHGLRTGKHLRAVSRWPPQELEGLLREILISRETMLVDVQILKLHFSRSFPPPSNL